MNFVGIEAPILLLAALSSLLVCVCALIAFLKVRRLALLVLVFLILGFSLASYSGYSTKMKAEEMGGYSGIVTARLTNDAARSAFGYSAYCELSTDCAKGVKALVYLPAESDLLCGQVITGKTHLAVLDEEGRDLYWNRGIALKCSFDSFELVSDSCLLNGIHNARRYAIDKFGEYGMTNAAILQALVCGYRGEMNDSGEYEKYKACGLAHIVAVSGAHLAIVSMLLYAFLKAVRTPRYLTVMLCILFLCAYLIFAGLPISSVRACAMVVLSLTSFIAKRRNASINALAICIMSFIFLDPTISVSVSFFLSSASTLGIILFSRLIGSWFDMRSKLANALIADPLSLTLASNVATIPYSASLFSQLSLIAPIANIVATPLFSFACISGLVCIIISFLLASFADFSVFFVSIASVCATPLSYSVDLLSKVPYASIAVDLDPYAMVLLSVVLSVLLWVVWPKVSRKALASLALAGCILGVSVIGINPIFSKDRLVMLDVGQGDAILFQSGGYNVLIDTGNQDSKLREALAKQSVYHLDAVFITHPDDDHCGSLPSLSTYVDLADVYVARDLLECPCGNCQGLRDGIEEAGCRLNGVNCGDRIAFGSISFDVIWPKQFADEGGNGDSLCFIASIDCDGDSVSDHSALLCGDAEKEQLEQMVQLGALGDIEIYKVGHHGSKASIDDGLVQVLKPEFSLVSVGRSNRYGHPDQGIIDVLESAGSKVLRTDECGSIEIEFEKASLNISAEEPIL